MTLKAEKEKENYKKKKQEIKDVHEADLRSIEAEISQLQFKLLELKGAGGQAAELVTQMVERNEGVKGELECPVCLEEMMPPKQIWMCQNGHSVSLTPRHLCHSRHRDN